MADRSGNSRANRNHIYAGITNANWKFLADWAMYHADVTKPDQLLLCDAQTSGGLLAAVQSDRAAALLKSLHIRGLDHAAIIGRIEAGTPSRIHVSRKS